MLFLALLILKLSSGDEEKTNNTKIIQHMKTLYWVNIILTTSYFVVPILIAEIIFRCGNIFIIFCCVQEILFCFLFCAGKKDIYIHTYFIGEEVLYIGSL